MLGQVKFELRSSRRKDWPTPEKYCGMFDTPSCWDLLDLEHLYKTDDELLLRDRRECWKVLIEYEESRVGTPWMNGSVVFPC